MDTDFYPARHGIQFDPGTGKAFLFEADSITVAIAWPKPMAWRKTRKGWRHVRLMRSQFSLPCTCLEREIWRIEKVVDDYGQYQFPFMQDSWDRHELARLKWYQTVPADIRGLVSPFRTRNWHLVAFLARCGSAARDLIQSSPALAFALASNWVFHKPAVQRPLRSARCLLQKGKNQKDILGWLGFPATNSARKLLARIAPAAVDISRLLYLRDALGNRELGRRMAHLGRLNAGTLRILTDPQLAIHATPRLLADISVCRDENVAPHAAYQLRDSVNMYASLFPGRRFPQPDSVARLSQLHDELVKQFHSLPPEELIFPRPPVQGNHQIVPIVDARDLWREGVEMNHCVSSYSRQIAIHQNVFVYKVLGPERCTLSLRRMSRGWTVSELKKSCNQQPSAATRRMVDQWLTTAWSFAGGTIRNRDLPR